MMNPMKLGANGNPASTVTQAEKMPVLSYIISGINFKEANKVLVEPGFRSSLAVRVDPVLYENRNVLYVQVIGPVELVEAFMIEMGTKVPGFDLRYISEGTVESDTGKDDPMSLADMKRLLPPPPMQFVPILPLDANSQYGEQAVGFARFWQWVDSFGWWLLSFKPPTRVTVQMANTEAWATALIPSTAQDWDDALAECRQGFLILRVSRLVPNLPGNKYCDMPHPSLVRQGDVLRVEVIPGSNI